MAEKLVDHGAEVEYLENNGWVFEAEGWIDPASKEKAKEVTSVIHDKRTGTVRKVVQLVKPPIRWRHDLQQALAIQRARDDNDGSGRKSGAHAAVG